MHERLLRLGLPVAAASLLASVAPQEEPAAQDPAPAPAAPADDLAAAELAARIDGALQAAWRAEGIEPAAPADDATWLRRLSVDLRGAIPSADEVAQFLASADPAKRERKIDEYLDDPAFAASLSHQWTQLLLAPAGKDSLRTQPWLRPWLERQFDDGVPFADVARELIAAAGSQNRPDSYAFALSYRESLETLSALVARTFLGVQIQCAQCHDHPYDRWKQEDFNAFTGSFLGMLGDYAGDLESRAPVFRVLDLSPEQELKERLLRIAERMLRKQRSGAARREPEMAAAESQASIDAVRRLVTMIKTSREDQSAFARLGNDAEAIAAFVAELPADLLDVIRQHEEKVERYSTVRFLDGTSPDPAAGATRRQALAAWITDPANPWFARAITNRVWGQLFGKGLTEPVDDLTGSSDRILEDVLAAAAAGLTASGTDLRFLYRALTRTQAYALGNPVHPDFGERARAERWFAAHPLRPFTAEQIIFSLARAVPSEAMARADAPEGRDGRAGRGGREGREGDMAGGGGMGRQSDPADPSGSMRERRGGRGDKIDQARAEDKPLKAEALERNQDLESERHLLAMQRRFRAYFSDDEGGGGDTFSASIPQALFLMNGAITNALNLPGRELPLEAGDDDAWIGPLFLATLSRLPTDDERGAIEASIGAASGSREQAVEDLFWALLNSTEFHTNR